MLLDFKEHEGVEIVSADAEDDAALLTVGSYEVGAVVPVSITFPSGRRQRMAVHPYGFWEQMAANAPGELADNIAAILIGHATAQAQVDALVTAHPLLLEPDNAVQKFVGSANPMTPHQAVAFLGLYLRSRDDYQFTNIMSTTQETLFDTLTEALLPAHWRWFGGCLASRLAGNSESPIRLARTTLQRVNRTLKARDNLHQQYFTPADEGAMQDAHAELDTILQQLAGAFDAVARVANRVYGIYAKPNRVKWAWGADRVSRFGGQGSRRVYG